MSSKFFTWTKGDRSRHASETLFTGAVVPIPVECIHIKGFDYSRTQKSNRRRPVPLNLQQSPEDLSSYDQQLDDSTALQDAAVKSATSLIAVVNDMLRSPLASARLPPQQSSLAPSHGRPRSRTAPSTPLVEAPARPAPVELPGSFPDRPRASYHHSFDGKLKTRMSQGPRHEHPCKSARRPSHPWLHLPLKSDDETSTANPLDVASKHQSHNLPQHSQWGSSPDDSRGARASMPPGGTTPQARQSYVSGPPASRHVLTSRESNPRLPRSSLNIVRKDNQPLIEDQEETLEHDEVPLSDIASLHASHEDHMVTIVEAHQREVTSLRMYINFLEQRRGLSRTNEVLSHESARSSSVLQASEKTAECQTMDFPGHRSTAASCLTQQNSHHGHIDSTIDAQCTSYAGYGEIWLECNHLRDKLETCRRQIAHAEETISRMHRLELSLKSDNGNLRSRLLAANNERMDVQEGLYEACNDLRKLAEREASLARENEELRRRSIHATRPTVSPDDTAKTTRQRKSGHCRTRSDVSYQHMRSGPPLAQNGMRTTMPSEDAQRQQSRVSLPESNQQAQSDDARRTFNNHKSQMSEFTLSSARAVSLTNVAATSLRAATRSATTAVPRTSEGQRKESLKVEDEGSTQTNEVQPSEHKLQNSAFDESRSPTPQSQQNTHPTTPKTKPMRTSYTSTARTPSPVPSLSSSKSSSTSSSTLAVSLPQTPRTVSSTTAGVPPMPTAELQFFACPRTPPAGVNKRLPNPPPLDPDPPVLSPAYSPVMKRGETMKSVGGSIIELYEGRGREDGSEWEREGHGEDKGWVEWV